MPLVVLLGGQAALMLLFALPTRYLLLRSEASEPVRVGLVALGGAVVVATTFAAFVAARHEDGWDIRCGRDLDVSAGVAYWLAVGLGGVALGGLAADRVRRGGVRAWHLAAVVAIVLVTLVAVAATIVAGLSCHYRG